MRELLFAFLATRPEFARAKSCRRELVGPMRQYLWRHGAAHEGSPDAMWTDAPPRALALVAERFGVAQQEVLAFGDSFNDIPMLRWAGMGIAALGAVVFVRRRRNKA